ncbi:nucleotidyltransferase domain-containing protein [Candidatus Pacearchaeota archaeon]|nr:nucleotidyltransferase domain-containing protein [Candidatus Pacearchaeota archaeon]
MKKKVKSGSASPIEQIPEDIKKKMEKVPTMQIVSERDIALDFATKVYTEFEQLVKVVLMFGSSVKQEMKTTSDIDIIVIVDDATLRWDEELVATYREELGKLIQANPYRRPLHVNTVKLSSWWQDLMRGDPVIINVIRYGDPLIDHAGFFSPLKGLLRNGLIRSTPEAIYNLLQRAPNHLARSQAALLSAVDGYYWACVDSAHAALIAAEILPPSPEHVGEIMEEIFVKTQKSLKKYYVDFYVEIHELAKDIVHGKTMQVEGKKIDELKKDTDEFVREMARLTEEMINKKR